MASSLAEDSSSFGSESNTDVSHGTVQERVQRLLGRPEIRGLFDRNESFAEELNSALYILAEDTESSDNEIEEAFKKNSNAITIGIRIFVSYKTSEEIAANKFLTILTDLIRTRMDRDSPFPFLAGYGSSIQAGADWREDIHKALRKTHWFFLLKPDETVDQDWLVFEAGYFRRGMMPGDKLICIHGANAAIPDQIKNLQGVKATPEKILDLLRILVKQRNAVPGMDAIEGEIEEDSLERASADIAALFARSAIPELKRKYFLNCVDLCLRDVQTVKSSEDLKQLKILQVEGADPVFGRPFPTETFGELISNLDSESQNAIWLEQLARAIGDALENRSPAQPTVSFRGRKDGWTYRPFLHAARIFDGATRPDSVHVAFVEDIAAPTRLAPPKLASLETALRLSYRFRWEILAEFNHPLTTGDIEKIERILLSMETEARQRGLYDPDTLASSFPDELAAQLKKNYVDYRKYRSEPPGNGEMDRALASKDPVSLANSLKEIGKMTRWFLREGSRVYADLVAKADDILE